MTLDIKTLDNESIGTLELDARVFGVAPRRDILARVTNWQLAKRRAGTHASKGVSAISGTTRKPWKQKGSGRARQGSLRSPQFRGGAVIFGPTPRSHAHDLPKKVRKLGLKMALSSRSLEGKLIILRDVDLAEGKTKVFVQKMRGLGLASALVIDGANINPLFARALRNVPEFDVLPEGGANVYDILRHDTLVLTVKAVEQLQARLAE